MTLSINQMPYTVLKIQAGEYEYQFEVRSEAQMAILQSFFFKMLDLKEYKVILPNGQVFKAGSTGFRKRRKVIISYPDKPELEIYSSSNDDLDILCNVLTSTLEKGASFKQYVNMDSHVDPQKVQNENPESSNGNWQEREMGCMYRSSIISTLREMPVEDVDILMRFGKSYSPYLKQMLAKDRSEILSALNIL